MRKCPLCDKEADSQHHIKPRSEGGSNEPRNLVWLCKACHNNVEGREFTPSLIESERRRLKGSAALGESYVFMVHGECIVFAGIRINDTLIPFGIRLPKEQPLANAQVAMPFHVSGKTPKGRPRKVISSHLAKILDEDISIREKARLTGLSRRIVQNYIKEQKAEYVADQGGTKIPAKR